MKTVQSIAEAATLVDALRVRARQRPSQAVYTFLENGEAEGSHLTFADLDRRARAIAAWLQAQDGAGKRVLLMYGSGQDFIEAFWGCLYAGAIAVPVYPPKLNRSMARVQSVAADADASIALTGDKTLGRLETLLDGAPSLRRLRWASTIEAVNDLADDWRPAAIGPDTLAFLQYTSGSTGAPKGVMLRHENLLHNQEMIRTAFRQNEESVIVGWLPLHHDMGLIGNVLQPLYVGARCVLMTPMAFLQKPMRWLQAVSRYRATTSGGPDFAYQLCVRHANPEDLADLDLSNWSSAFNGAEPIRAKTLEDFAAMFEPYGFRRRAFYPCYGLAEATLLVSGGQTLRPPIIREVGKSALEADRVEGADKGEDARSLVGCGGAFLGQEIVIVDPNSLRRRPDDEVGEIWVSGPSVASGYWRQEDETNRSFRARLANDDTKTYLRTGDLGFLSEGELFVTGRLKDMIIVRGRNLYPHDVERAIESSHTGLRQGCGAAFSIDAEAGEQLAIVQEVESRWKGNFDDALLSIRMAVMEEFEIQPGVIVLVKPGGVPKTSSGKIQRRACRELYETGALEELARWRSFAEIDAESPAADPPEEDAAALGQWLRSLLAAKLQVDRSQIDPDRPLNDYGFDSLTAIELAHSIGAKLRIRTQMADLLEGRSLAQLSEELFQLFQSSNREDDLTLPLDDSTQAEHPLSYGQHALWFLQQMEPENSAYNLARAMRIRGRLQIDALSSAFDRAFERHPELRTSFHLSQGEPVQCVRETSGSRLLHLDASQWSDAEINAYLNEQAIQPFKLDEGSPLRVTLLSRSSSEHVLLLVAHHIAVDFWSLALLWDELKALYQIELENSSANLRLPPRRYIDYARWQRRLLDSAEGEKLRAFWRQRLAGDPPALSLPHDRPRPALQTFRGGACNFKISKQVTRSLKGLAERRNVTLYTALLAVFEAFLHRYTGQDDLLVGSPTTGRSGAEFARTMGYFVNPIVLRADLSGNPSFEELLEKTRRGVLDALAHQDYPFALLVQQLQPERDARQPTLIQAMFALQQTYSSDGQNLSWFALGEDGGRMAFADLLCESMAIEQRAAQFDLTLSMADCGEEIAGCFEYSLDLFDRSTIEGMAANFQTLVEGLCAAPSLRILDAPLISPDERRRLLVEFNATETGDDLDDDLVQLIEERAGRTPDAIAVVYSGQHLSYRELNARANRAARCLKALGVGPESTVGIFMERTADLPAATLGTLKAGAAYAPLDPTYPQERLQYMAENARVAALLSQAHLLERAPAVAAPILCIESLLQRSKDEDDQNLPIDAAGENPAYVIFTSGSTGKPKGVAASRRSLLNLARWHRQSFAVSAADRATQLASFAFDASVWEIWPYLAAGASLFIVPDEVRASPAALGRWLREREINLCFMPTPLAESWMESGETDCPALRTLLVGGDKMHGGRRSWPDCKIVNNYGPTESTVVSTSYSLEHDENASAPAPPIGRPIANTRIMLLGESGELSPASAVGELYIGGAGLARGYLHNPALTAEKFIPDPYSGELGARLYQTGDLARWRADGTLEYLERKDAQVKVRGYRIELSEVESALAASPLVRECVVAALEEAPGDKRLIAYFVANDGAGVSAAELRSFLKGKLPEYMVPAAFVPLDQLPITRNGKVNRKALPAPKTTCAEAIGAEGGGLALPSTQIEELVCGVWREALGVQQVGLDDNFFELGGHSLIAARALSRVGEVFHIELPVRSLFEHQTAREFSARVAEAIGAGEQVDVAPIEPASPDARSELSFAQQRLWFLDQMEIGRASYNAPAAVLLSGRLDVQALARSLDEIVRRHEALRTCFKATGAGPIQIVSPDAACPVSVVDLREMNEPARRLEAERLAVDESRLPFDLATPPLLRARLLWREENEHTLLLTMHHIVSDAWSLWLLTRELSILYEAFSTGRPSPLEPLRIQYADYAAWQRRRLSGALLEKQLAYWKRQLSGPIPLLALPADFTRPAVRSYRGATLTFQIPESLSARLGDFSRRHNATVFMTLLAAFQALLYRYTRQTDVLIGAPAAGRVRPELENLIGCFVNTLVFRGETSGDLSFTELTARVRETTLEAYANQEAPFETLVEELQPERSLSRSTLFDVMFVLQNTPPPILQMGDLRVEPQRIDNGTAKLDLLLSIAETGRSLEGALEWNTDLFSRATIERMIGHYLQIVESATANPGGRLSETPLLTDAERRLLLSEWAQQGARLVPHERTTPELFEAQVRRTPDAVALVCGERSLSYRELNERANRLAHFLRRRGVGQETVVGIFLDRSVDLVTALLGTLKAGGAYAPLDPNYPAERLHFMLEDSRAAILLTTRDLRDKLEAHRAETVCLDADWSAISRCSGDDPAPLASPDNLAYLIYTSGSTGKPKGVSIRHHSAAIMIHWARANFTDAELAGVVASTSICFDLSVFEIFVPLSWGGKVILVANALEIPETSAAGAATLINTVPSAMKELVRSAGTPDSVTTVNLAGEPLQNSLVQSIYQQRNIERVLNLYGPSEDTTYSTWMTAEKGGSRPITIGRPINNTQVYLLDPDGQLTPQGVAGELFLGGEGLARGYLYRPALTAERFVPDPFSGESSARLYRTGDLTRYLPDGEIEFLGRADHQVKIRGFRIELKEIEELLLQRPDVREAVVVARADERTGDQQLVCYATAKAGAAPAVSELRRYLREKAPEYMVPALFMLLDEMPLTPNGKIDRKTLPAPDMAAPAAGASFVAPSTEVEEALARIWASLLGLESVGIEDSFFELGGHSLLAARIISRIREELGADLPLRSLFETPTIAELAMRIEGHQKVKDEPLIRAMSRDADSPLSFAQESLWVHERLSPGAAGYNVLGGMRLKGALDVATMNRALDEIVRRHESLRTTFRLLDGRPVQTVSPYQPVRLATVDFSGRRSDDLDIAIREIADREMMRPFDLASGPLLRVVLLNLNADELVILVSMHHIISDGWSIGIFIDEAIALYRAFLNNEPSPLAALPVQYADYARWQRQWFAGEARDSRLAYWRKKLGGAPPALHLPVRRDAPAGRTSQGATLRRSLAPGLYASLLELGRRNQATLYMTLLAAFQTLLHQYSKQDDILLGAAVAGRNRVDLEGLIGLFINMVVLRGDLSGNPTFLELLGRTREATLEALAHQDTPFEKLVEELQPQRAFGRTPFFSVAFGLQAAPKQRHDLPGLELHYLAFDSKVARYDLTLWMLEGGDGLSALWTYSKDLFDAPTIERMHARLETLLRSVVDDPNRSLSLLDSRTEEERKETAAKEKEISDLMKAGPARRKRRRAS